MSHVHVRRLAGIRREFVIVQLAVLDLEAGWPRRDRSLEPHGVRLEDIRQTGRHLEATYIVRLLSEFEAILQEHLALSRPGIRIPAFAEALINRVATRHRVPDAIRDGVQVVREYRNSVVHRRLISAQPLRFFDAVRALNHFLILLPDIDPGR